MKKIFLIAVVALGFTRIASAAIHKNISSDLNIRQEKEFTPIEASAIPSDVLKNISLKYGGFTIKEAHVAKDGEYKLILAKDEKTVTAYFSLTGEFIKEA